MRWLKRILLLLVVLLAAAQFFRPVRANPPVDESKTIYATTQVPDDARAILDRSCIDCHTNRTTWPWYSNVSPLSWWLVDHVTEAREEMNLSAWGTYTDQRRRKKLEQICEEVEEGEMPLKSYVPLHPSAKLTEADRETLCRWTKAALAE
jgi:mono/diheme cytochrome c family protein